MTRKKHPISRWSTRIRRSTGNMLALMVACALGFIVLLLFALSYVRLLGSHGEQKTAIESASMAAAKDISSIVINDPNFGYIGFSDSAPVGAGTKAPDNYYMPVSSINSLMGTIRLDLIIANQLSNPEMKALALRDLTNLKTAKDKLISVINTAISGPGSTAKDAAGNTVSPYEDAVAAYQSNSIRMTGSSSYVNGSMHLTLGSIPNGETNIPIPQPVTYANCDSTQQVNGFYVANVPVPTPDGTQFVFANLGNTVRLVDNRAFQTSIADLPFQMPSVVKAEADQNLSDNGTSRIQHSAAAAQGCNVYDPKPAPGLLSIAFPDGIPPEVTKPGDLLKPPFTGGTPVISQTPKGGDYPTDTGSILNPLGGGGWTGLPGAPTAGGAVGVGYYDWLRRGGARVNVDSFVNAMNSVSFNDSGNSKDDYLTTNLYTFDPTSGDVVYTSRKLSDPTVSPPAVGSYNPTGPDPISVVSDQQLFATGLNALSSADTFAYDLYLRDQGFHPGTKNGGQHGGEPMDQTLLTATANHIDSTNMTISCADLEPVKIASSDTAGSGSSFDCGGQGDGAHWGIQLGAPPAALIAQLNVTVPVDGHQISFIVYANAILTRNDFGLPGPMAPYATYTTGPAAGYNRPTYLQNGLVTEVRMRRLISLTKTGLVGGAYGNTGNRKYPPPPPYPVSPSFTLP